MFFNVRKHWLWFKSMLKVTLYSLDYFQIYVNVSLIDFKLAHHKYNIHFQH
jgi:hypothetical protein